MRRDYEKLFTKLKPQEPPVNLFERIILAIKQEQQLQKTRRLLFSFLFLLITSIASLPFSFNILVDQLKNSGTIYFISTAISNFSVFLTLWKDFGLAVLESLPITGILAFSISVGLSIFTLRLFLYKKGLLLSYFKGNFV